jgi:hypothetical protein
VTFDSLTGGHPACGAAGPGAAARRINRLAEVNLELHPQDGDLYCKDEDRAGSRESEKFTFLGV